MFCSQCGQQLASGVRFCPRCGSPVNPLLTGPQPAPPAPTVGQIIQGPEGRTTIKPGRKPSSETPAKPKSLIPWAIVAAILVIVLLLLMLLLKPRTPQLEAEAAVPPPVLVKPANRPAPTPPVTMPDDVRAYLEFIQGIEKKKQDLSNRQLAGMRIFATLLQGAGAGIGEISPETDQPGEDPQQTTKAKFDDLRPEWQALVDEVGGHPAPPECQPLADEYSRAMNEIPAMMGDLGKVLDEVQSDPQDALAKAQTMQGKSSTEIDPHFRAADEQVGALCSKYGVAKWFSISSDSTSGLLGVPGGGVGVPSIGG